MSSECDYCDLSFDDAGECLKHMLIEHAPPDLDRAVSFVGVAIALQGIAREAFDALEFDLPDYCLVMLLDVEGIGHVSVGGGMDPAEATEDQRKALSVHALQALNEALVPWGVQLHAMGPFGQG